MSKLGANIFQIAANSYEVVVKQNSGIFPTQHENFIVFNIGRTPIKAEVLFGTGISWLGAIVPQLEIQPGEEKILNIDKNLYFVTGVKIYNDCFLRALVHCGKVNDCDWNQKPKDALKLDVTLLSKTLVKYGPANFPIIGESLVVLIDFFWPQFEAVWNLSLDSEYELHARTKADLIQLKDRLVRFNFTVEHVNNTQTTPYYFMHILDELLGFEKKFILNPEVTDSEYFNFMFLPYYSAFISLKICLYQYGILNQEKIGLSEEQVNRLLLLTKQLIENRADGAIIYITRIFKEILNKQYITCEPEQIYETLAIVRTWCGLAGFEFFRFWNEILNNPYRKSKPYNDVIVYSTYFGRLSPHLARQMIPENVEEPLQPKLNSDGVRNKLVKIEVFIWRKNYKTSPKISGMNVHFQSGKVYNLGKGSPEVRTVEFNGFPLVKLIAWGDNCIDCLEFIFSNGRKEMCGSKTRLDSINFTFELEYHQIVGIYMANDVPSLQGQAANVAVSYQLISE